MTGRLSIPEAIRDRFIRTGASFIARNSGKEITAESVAELMMDTITIYIDYMDADLTTNSEDRE